MIRALIIDDEPDAIEVLRELIAHYCPEVEVLGEANSALAGVKLLNKLKPDLVFLDVQMPNGNGFDFLEAIEGSEAKIVLTTAHPEFAIKAVKMSVYDYLLKPIDDEELRKVIDRILDVEQEVASTLVGDATSKGILNIPTFNGIQFIERDKIVCVKSDGNYSTFFLENGSKVVYSKSLKSAEEMLQTDDFFRLHNSYIINLKMLGEYKKSDGGSVVLKGGMEVPISRRRKDEFLKKIIKSN